MQSNDDVELTSFVLTWFLTATLRVTAGGLHMQSTACVCVRHPGSFRLGRRC